MTHQANRDEDANCDRPCILSAASPSGAPAPVFFGGMTALQIARAARIGRRRLPEASMRSLPESAPKRGDVLAAIARAESLLPGLHLDRPVHVAVGGSARVRGSELCVANTCTARLPGHSFLNLGQKVYASVPELAFVQVAATEKDLVKLLLLGYELCGSYATARTCGVLSRGMPSYQVEPLATVRSLSAYAARCPSMKGAGRVARAARYLADNSASPRETQLALVLGLPRSLGGGGLGIPAMNYRLDATEEARALADRSYFLLDLCWPKAKLDVEYQSKEMHANDESLKRDTKRANALDAMGWKVTNIASEELDSERSTDGIANTIGKRLGKDKRVRLSDYSQRKRALRRQLGLPCGREEWL